MKKKIFLILGLIIIILVCIIIYFISVNSGVEEYVPEEEISENDYKMASVILYFQNKETKELEAEIREINSKELLLNPYEVILEMLLIGPINENLEKLIPNGVVINNIILEKYCLKIDFSKEFIENCEDDKLKQENIVNSIYKTMKELTEVNEVKILIDGVEGLGFKNGEIIF